MHISYLARNDRICLFNKKWQKSGKLTCHCDYVVVDSLDYYDSRFKPKKEAFWWLMFCVVLLVYVACARMLCVYLLFYLSVCANRVVACCCSLFFGGETFYVVFRSLIQFICLSVMLLLLFETHFEENISREWLLFEFVV